MCLAASYNFLISLSSSHNFSTKASQLSGKRLNLPSPELASIFPGQWVSKFSDHSLSPAGLECGWGPVRAHRCKALGAALSNPQTNPNQDGFLGLAPGCLTPLALLLRAEIYISKEFPWCPETAGWLLPQRLLHSSQTTNPQRQDASLPDAHHQCLLCVCT